MVELQSLMSLLIEVYCGEKRLSTATGFVSTRRRLPYLITNRHVFTGRDNNTREVLDKDALTPDRIYVWFTATRPHVHSLRWQGGFYDLYDDEKRARWFEHPTHGAAVDVVAIALPAPAIPDIRYNPYDLDVPEGQSRPRVTTDVQVVGFPFGRASVGDALNGPVALWTRGTIASEPEVDYDGLPRILVDARTRYGQSGSPVLIDGRGEGLKFQMEWANLLGVYSGRINKESDLGVVWRLSAIREIIDGKHRPDPPDESDPYA
jgi:hypothetical protein